MPDSLADKRAEPQPQHLGQRRAEPLAGPRSEHLGDADLGEILAALELPPKGLESWFAGLQSFCASHGGARYYSELMALFDACQERLAGTSDQPARTSRESARESVRESVRESASEPDRKL